MLRNLKYLKPSRKFFSELVPKEEKQILSTPKTSLEVLSETTYRDLGISAKDLEVALKTGADLYLTPEKQSIIKSGGFFFRDQNDEIDLVSNSHTGWQLTYLRNMGLLKDYDTIFRDFLQCCARTDMRGLKLVTEPRFNSYMQKALHNIKVVMGMNLELDSLKILQNYRILRTELYKNLYINRYENKPYQNYKFTTNYTPLGSMVVAKELNEDTNSFALNPKPFILATTMLIQSPMKMAILNQNMSKKIHGDEEEKVINYVVRFETQMNFSDFTWVLPTQNKPKRLRNTVIADFNNVIRGNPYFLNEKWDLYSKDERYKYMSKDSNYDKKAFEALQKFLEPNI